MLLIQSAKRATWNLYNPMTDNVLNVQFKLPKKRFCGFAKGWLIAMNMNLVVTLINPFYRVKGKKKREDSIINLPPQDRNYGNFLHEQVIAAFVIKPTISVDPILNPNNCIVVAIYEGRGILAFIRLNKDTTWTYVDESLSFIQDVVHVEDKFYVVEEGGTLFSFDIISQCISNKQLVAQGIESDEVQKTYLVVLNDKELLMVLRYITFKDRCRVTTKVEIFELNFDKYEWVEKNTLGDVALFLGDNFSIFVVASNFSGCRPNCIYFDHDYERIERGYDKKPLHRDFGVYDIERQSFSQPYTSDANTLMEKTMQPPYWVGVPTFLL
ncbi:hypothetical protein L3X38_013749 [Prunus dulcis]|uniref:KIB1-4 beta-propeller domain-containing protein n=1 Tax=Prunus dulcis TaxID=3755 RepID=A0AAD4WPJ4_PRUDU|nr:hypothetical protein L3X38_013749 [Prunus dulcis]